MFSNVFRQLYLNSATRNDDEENRARVSFSFTAVGAKAAEKTGGK
jgi:hypothetical protein